MDGRRDGPACETAGDAADGRMHLSHLQVMLLFAGIISLAFGFLSRRRVKDQLKSALWSFVLFLVVGVAIAWLIYPFSR